ncbi:MAG TPA: hypothetical protein VN247_05265 [Arenimonas sp.]|nr:hypothetical protein [Arenimonas sp.]
MVFKTYKVISDLLDEETRKKVFAGLEIYNGVLYGRVLIFAALLSLFLIGNYIKGGVNLVELSTSEGINFFDQHFIIQDYHGNCKTLIDSDYNIIEAKPVHDWGEPSNCINYNKLQLFGLVFQYQLEARRDFSDIFWPYVFVAVVYFLFALHAAIGSFYVAPVNITPVALCVSWLCIAVLLFPVLFRDHKPGASYTSGGIEYTTASVYLAYQNRYARCPTPLMGKLNHCSIDTQRW